ncbi:unnamed protein product, partial [Symbiodinium pilosum]
AVQDRRHHFGGSSAHESPVSGVTEKRSAHLSADMLHMCSTIMHPAFREIVRVMHLTCIHVVLVLRTVACQLTWQRSRFAPFEPFTIQGGRRLQNDDYDMEQKDDDKRVPSFDGRLDQYRDYRKRALLYFHGLEDSKQSLAAPRLIANLSGSAFECFREKDPGAYRNESGVINMLALLDARLQFTPEQELSDWLENLLYRMRRRRGEETTAFTTRFETTIFKVEDLISTEQRLERRRLQDQRRAEYRRQSLDYMVAKQAHDAALAALQEGQTAPVAPAPPSELPAVEPFAFPEVVKGFLYLRHVGITLQTRAILLRSSGGSLRYDRVAELLRKTELDAMVASRTSAVNESSFLADIQEDGDDDDEDDEEWSDDEDYDDDDFGGFAEDEETDEGDDEGDLGEPDEEYDTAMLGYLEARQKLLALRKSRGFKEPDGQSSKQSGQTKPRAPGHRDLHREGRGRPSSSTGRSRDFQWKEKRSTSSQGRPRQKTPPPGKDRRSKGKGKSKSKGHGKRQGTRREPAGAQYLGMATASSSAMLSSHGASPMPRSFDFQPQFDFMAYHVGDRPEREFSFGTHNVPTSVESMVDECLLQDDILGLSSLVSSRAESCCLVTPPGHAILDTGKAPFLLSIQALRQMKAKLDCERDVLEIPGIGNVKLTTNQVGHYLLPLFQFGYHTAEDPSFATEGEYEDLTRPPGLGDAIPSEVQDKGPGAVGSKVNEAPLPEKTGSPQAVDVPHFESVLTRSEIPPCPDMNMTARVPEGPRDVKTVFALLNGKNVEFEGARVRSFQLPPKSSGLSVSQLAKRSTYCAMHGDLLEEYYFNQPPANVMCQQALVANQHVGRCLIDQVVPEPEHCAISECDEYHSCSEGEDGDWVLPWQVCASGSSRGLNATHVLPLRESASGKIREQALHHVTYFPLKDCPRTCLPAPPQLRDGDLVQDAGAPDHIIDKVGNIPYPLNVRKVMTGVPPPEVPHQAGVPSGTGLTHCRQSASDNNIARPHEYGCRGAGLSRCRGANICGTFSASQCCDQHLTIESSEDKCCDQPHIAEPINNNPQCGREPGSSDRRTLGTTGEGARHGNANSGGTGRDRTPGDGSKCSLDEGSSASSRHRYPASDSFNKGNFVGQGNFVASTNHIRWMMDMVKPSGLDLRGASNYADRLLSRDDLDLLFEVIECQSTGVDDQFDMPHFDEQCEQVLGAGAAPWLLRQAERFRCAVCESQKPPPSHTVVGSAKPRSFNSILAIDTLDLTLQRDDVQYRVFLLTAVDTATSFARAFHLEAGDAATAVDVLDQGWFQAYGSPEVIYTDPDTIFRSEHFAQFLTRNAVLERLTAAQSPWQHGQVERLHRTIRQQAQRVFESERTCSPYQAVVHVLQARNELMRVEGVSPSVLVFGKLPRAPPDMAESDEDFRCLAVRLHNEEAGVSGQQTFKEMKHARGVDVRNERPSSAELETERDKPDKDLVLEQLGPEADYEPLPQAPRTPAPGTPGPHTPAPGTPLPGTPVPGTPRSAPLRPELVSTQPIPPAPPADASASAHLDTRRGEKRSSEPRQDVEAESLHRAQQGPTPVVSQDESSIRYILQEMCLSAAAMKKRGAEVVEKYLNEEEKAMFRTAKHAEWSQWVGNEVVELISRHAVLTVAAQNMWRIFTLVQYNTAVTTSVAQVRMRVQSAV